MNIGSFTFKFMYVILFIHYEIVEELNCYIYHVCSAKETFILVFVQISKHSLQNFWRILERYFLGTLVFCES